MTYSRFATTLLAAAVAVGVIHAAGWMGTGGRLDEAGQTAPPGQSARIEKLIAAIRDRAPWVVRVVADALARRREPRAVPGLLAATRSADANVRVSAATALGAIRDRHALPRLRAMQRDRDQVVRAAAAKAILKFVGHVRGSGRGT